MLNVQGNKMRLLKDLKTKIEHIANMYMYLYYCLISVSLACVHSCLYIFYCTISVYVHVGKKNTYGSSKR